MKHLFYFLFTFFTFTFGQTQGKYSLPNNVLESIEKRLEFGHSPSYAIGVVNADGTHYFSFGSKTSNGDPVDEHTIYEIGSISKVFTGILLANSQEKGLLNIDDPIENYLPERVTAPEYDHEKITLGNLSDHTSSLPRMPDNFSPANPANPYADYTVDQMYDFIDRHELRRKIGSQYEYSNLAQGLLGHLLATRAGSSFEKLLAEVITGPLNMKETKIVLNKKMKKNLALGHSNGVEVENWDIPTLAGAGGIRSSVYDMLIFLSANLGMINKPILSSMEKSHEQRHELGGMGVGLGWHIIPGSKGDVIWHNGGTGGYRTFAGFVKEMGMGVVVLTNSTKGADDIGFHLLDPASTLPEIKPSATRKLKESIRDEGIEMAVTKYKELERNDSGQYQFSESEMNQLGYEYLENNELESALAVFHLNVESFPNSSNVYDSYAEALMNNDQNEQAIENYKKSLELNPGNANGIQKLKELDIDFRAENLILGADLLKNYTGTYNLAPGFDIVISSEGNQLFGQATGQPKFELFAKSETEFFLKVVDAQIVFKTDASGIPESFALFQGGQEIPGKKIK